MSYSHSNMFTYVCEEGPNVCQTAVTDKATAGTFEIIIDKICT